MEAFTTLKEAAEQAAEALSELTTTPITTPRNRAERRAFDRQTRREYGRSMARGTVRDQKLMKRKRKQLAARYGNPAVADQKLVEWVDRVNAARAAIRSTV